MEQRWFEQWMDSNLFTEYVCEQDKKFQQIIRAIDAHKPIYTESISGAMKMLIKGFTKTCISAENQTKTQIHPDDPYGLNNNMEWLKFLGFDLIPKDLTTEYFANFHDTVAETEAVLSDNLIILMVCNSDIEEEVESNEKDCNDTIRTYDKRLENQFQ